MIHKQYHTEMHQYLHTTMFFVFFFKVYLIKTPVVLSCTFNLVLSAAYEQH